MSDPPSAPAPRPTPAVAGPIGFLGAYLLASPVSDALADRPLPLPFAPVAETVAYFAANATAVVASAALQVVSVACFAVFVGAVAPVLRTGRRGAGLPTVGWLSVAAMVVSSVLACAAALVARSGSAGTVDVLRQASFFAGGVANVVTLGVFVFGAAAILGREVLPGRATWGFGVVAGALAMLSVLSLVFYYANVLLPVGRVLSMVWTVIVGVRLGRAGRPSVRSHFSGSHPE